MKNILLLITVLIGTSTLFASIPQSEKDALTDLYIATQGEKWLRTWDLNEPVEKWHGVTVVDNSVTSISLLFNNLDGILPNSIGDFPNLFKLELSFNKLSGKIPTNINQLHNLEIFAINGNNISGTIPSNLGNLKNLKEFHVSSNSLEGSIPISIGSLENLKVFNVFDNNLTGTMPYSLSNNENLTTLVIAKNEIINTDAFAKLTLFEGENDSQFKNNTIITPAKTIIANETSDDEND
ncbi:Two component regulator three Y domain protein [Patiriisocius sp. Uisw_017]|uniref:Two component regulator three Y domain protein n=1 Tax=Patiriisocius sp. Uisw_017 TaxID=3230968 RepID=UPI0039EA49F7